MENIRKDIREFAKWGDVLMYGKGMEAPLTAEEVNLLELYISRIREKLNLCDSSSHPNIIEHSSDVNGKEPHTRLSV
jgi:hypothetical protein